MKYRFIALYLVFCLSSIITFAQTVEPAETLDKRIIQFEIETSYALETNANEKVESLSIPSLLLRYGVTNALELQFSIPLIKENHFEDDLLIHTNHLIDDMQLGLQYRLWDEHNGIPQTALMVRSVLPSSNIKFDELSYITSLNFNNNITEKISLGYNLGVLFGKHEPTTAYYIVSTTYKAKKMHYFIENNANFVTNHSALHNLTFGLGVDFTSNFTIDFSTTTGINHNLFAIGAIFIYNFKL